MKMSLTSYAVLLMGVVSLASVVGCGGGNTSPNPQAKTVEPTAPVEVATASAVTDEVATERGKLSTEDRALVDAQEWCVISHDERLGSMGAPLKLDINGQAVFVCCKGCKKSAESNPDKTLAKLEELKAKKKAAAGAAPSDAKSEAKPEAAGEKS